MELTISRTDILTQLIRQLESHFILTESERNTINRHLDDTFNECENNFLHSDNKYYTNQQGGHKVVIFNPYHSVQYMIFLYYLSHRIYLQERETLLCDKIYYLNKIMNGVDLFYAINLPSAFGAEHPVGSVMGRAKYGEYFMFYQNCTVGGIETDKGVIYPCIGNNVHMYANSSIIGDCKIGDNVCIGAGALVKNEDIADNSLVFGLSPNLIIKPNNKINIFGI